MGSFTGKFTLNEMLRILIPGFYALLVFQLAFKDFTFMHLEDSTLQLTAMVILSILAGSFLYALDVPKSIKGYKRLLPTYKVQKMHPGLKSSKIHNSFFKFYDDYSNEARFKLELYIGLYHLNVNLCLAGAIGFVFLIATGKIQQYWIMNALVVGMAVLSAVMLIRTKIRFSFERQLDAFFDSESYRTLIQTEEKENDR